MISKKRRFQNFDWIHFAFTLTFVATGLIFVFSSTYTPEKPISFFFKKQVLGTCIGLIVYFLCTIMPLRVLGRLGYFGFMGVICLLLYTLFLGKVGGLGAKRWISLYFFNIQPSELAKLCFPLFVGYYFNEEHGLHVKETKLTLSRYMIPLIALFLGTLLIVRQPDLGTGIAFFILGIAILWIAGLSTRFIAIMALVGVLSTPIMWTMLRPYQKQRVMVLLGKEKNRKDRYQIEQAKIAVGSGGLTGKGFMKGTQNKLCFLPEDHTDFIFAVIAEELGFAGAAMTLLLFLAFMLRTAFAITELKTVLGQLIASGLLVQIFLSVIINVGMTLGILPVVGMSLPLFSYGLTNLWATLASFGIIGNIIAHRSLY
ncbi:rod shape-determining protein RodA [bacterium]|nr:rod shape-determining protein RodA [bacterium]